MQTNILWSGIEYYSLENCIIDCKNDSISINSTIVGFHNEKIYRINYSIQLDEFWQTNSCVIASQFDDKIEKIEIIKTQNKWLVNGQYHPEFNACIDIDIPLTPLTNSLPINRLKLKQNQEIEIDVIYIDLFAHHIKHVKQRYKKISNEIYKYENIPNDFEAQIMVDDGGFVIDYPQLFKRTFRIQSNYH